MRDKLKKIVAYIFRSWEDETNPPHPQIKFIPQCQACKQRNKKKLRGNAGRSRRKH